MQRRSAFTVSLDNDIIAEIEEKRGIASLSRFTEELVKLGLKYYKN